MLRVLKKSILKFTIIFETGKVRNKNLKNLHYSQSLYRLVLRKTDISNVHEFIII